MKLLLWLKKWKKISAIEIKVLHGNNQFVYYDNSKILNNLRYFPFILGFSFCLIFFSFWFLRTIKKTDEGYLWAGLAKETAHQIGTPFFHDGWMEIMKLKTRNLKAFMKLKKILKV
jgi:hypothetical protein